MNRRMGQFCMNYLNLCVYLNSQEVYSVLTLPLAAPEHLLSVVILTCIDTQEREENLCDLFLYECFGSISI